MYSFIHESNLQIIANTKKKRKDSKVFNELLKEKKIVFPLIQLLFLCF